MKLQKVNFNCPPATVQAIDQMAKDDHRDRTSMLHKIIAFYFQHHPQTPNGQRPITTKKAGVR